MSTQTIIILGGGFAGVKCARALGKRFGKVPHRIILFNRENHMVFHPLLAEVASAAAQPKDVAAPLRQLIKDAECRTEEVLNIDLVGKFVEYEAHNGMRKQMHFDHLVIACGNEANRCLVPGMDEHAFGLKTIGDALALQAHVMEQLEKAEVCDDDDLICKRRYLSFVIVGGGFSGVEIAGEINDLVRRSCKFFKHISKDDVNVTVVHSHSELLPEVSPSLRRFARRRMEAAGVKVLTNAHAARACQSGVVLKDGTRLAADTVICTIGTVPSPLIARLSGPKTNGRLVTEPDMSLPGFPYVWAIGDCAAIVNAETGNQCPPVAQFAERQGRQVADNIFARVQGEPTRPFSFKMLGQLCAIGGRDAVADIMGLRLSGFIAWFLWRGVYLMKLPSIPQKIKVGLEWACDLVFPRTLAHLKTDCARRVSRAYLAAGDWVFQEGDPATDFYMIQQGEVEVVRQNEPGQEDIVAVLGVGDFFGEGALIEGHCRNAGVRARTNTELVVLGKNVFSQISGALTPFKESLALAMKRRSRPWKNLEYLKDVLESIPLAAVMNTLPGAPLSKESTAVEAIERINKHVLDFCSVADREGVLIGIVTRSDLLHAIELAASVPRHERPPLLVKDIMVAAPVAISLDDSTLLAFATMRERGMKRLPIVESNEHRVVLGFVRIENIMDQVVQRLSGAQKEPLSSAPTSTPTSTPTSAPTSAPTKEIDRPAFALNSTRTRELERPSAAKEAVIKKSIAN